MRSLRCCQRLERRKHVLPEGFGWGHYVCITGNDGHENGGVKVSEVNSVDIEPSHQRRKFETTWRSVDIHV